MKLGPRDLILLALVVVGFGGAAVFRPGLIAERAAITPPRGRVPGEDLDGSGSALAAVLGPAAGFFRPVALNVLWLRLGELQADGRFFEAASLAAAIAELQPRVPGVWTFQAWNLAFNISSDTPVAERPAWVLEGIRLLRDRGLVHNPGSAQIYCDLSRVFFFKIDGVIDDASLLYKQKLARELDVDPALPEDAREERRLAHLAEWRLDPRLLDRIAREQLGAGGDEAFDGRALDLRVASTHGLYWAVAGLQQPEHLVSPWDRFRLGRHVLASLRGLLEHGHVVRGGRGDAFAFAPDLRFVGAVAAALAREETDSENDPLALEDVRVAKRAFHRQLAFYMTLWNRHDDAEGWWKDAGFDTGEESLGRFLGNQVIHPDDRVEATRELVLGRVARLLRGVLGLSLAGEQDLAAGVRRITQVFCDDWNRDHADAPLPTLDDAVGAIARDWYARLSADESTRTLATRLRAIAAPAFRGVDTRGVASFGFPPPSPMDHADSVLLFPGLDSIGPVAPDERVGR